MDHGEAEPTAEGRETDGQMGPRAHRHHVVGRRGPGRPGAEATLFWGREAGAPTHSALEETNYDKWDTPLKLRHLVFFLATEPIFTAAQSGNWVQVPALLPTGCEPWRMPLSLSLQQCQQPDL